MTAPRSLSLGSARLPAGRPRSRLAETARRLLRGPTGTLGLLLLFLCLAMALAPDLLAPGDPLAIDPVNRLKPPSWAHPFGTDDFGRDLLRRVIHGARYSLGSAALVVGLAIVVGTVVGAVAGWAGGLLDEGLMRLTDLFLAFPVLVVAMAIVSALGLGLTNTILALAVLWWASYARLVRAQVLTLRGALFVEAARTLGLGSAGILFRHILPNCVSPLLVKATLDIGTAVLVTSGLSFLGLGVQPPTPEWGAMVTSGRQHMLDSWWYPTFPGLAIFLAVMAVNLAGDSLRDALDPKLRY